MAAMLPQSRTPRSLLALSLGRTTPWLLAAFAISCSKSSGSKTSNPETSESPSTEQVEEPFGEEHSSTEYRIDKVKAHRGSSIAAPENSLSALRLAFQEGADACEIDVRLTKDKQVVMYHDEDTARIGGRERLVASQTLEQLRELDIGAWKGDEFAGERIATLTEVLAEVPEDALLFVEIKDGVEAVPTVVSTIEKTPTKGDVALESFSSRVLMQAKKLAPHLPVHLTIGAKKDDTGNPIPFALDIPKSVKQLGFDGLSVDRLGLTREFALETRAQGLSLAVWTINTESELTSLRGMPITWVETDTPKHIRQLLSHTPSGGEKESALPESK